MTLQWRLQRRNLLCALLGCFLANLCLQTAQAATPRPWRLVAMQAPLQIQRAGKTSWQNISVATASRVQLADGDMLRTGRGGWAEIRLGKKRVLRLGELTKASLHEGLGDSPKTAPRQRPGELRLALRLAAGKVWFAIGRKLNPRREQLMIRTPTAVIGVKGTRFGVDHETALNVSKVKVLEGQVGATSPAAGFAEKPTAILAPQEVAPPAEVSQAQWVQAVLADQVLEVDATGMPQVRSLTPEEKKDPWLEFNQQRDVALLDLAALK